MTGAGGIVHINRLEQAGEIIGSLLGDTLEYNDPATPAFWTVTRDNLGTLNELRFSNIRTTKQSSPGSSFDLYARMDNIYLDSAPFTLIIYPGGYFHSIRYVSGEPLWI